MPINIPDDLPAASILESEKIFVMNENRARHQDIRPLEILIFNLMPSKVETETQILRLLSNSPIQIDIDLLRTETYISKHTSQDYLRHFYKTFNEIKNKKYDGMIITGAPVENMAYESVKYWREFCEILDWSLTNSFSTMHICWGALAALYYHYGIPKHPLNEKISGIYAHVPLDYYHPLLRGFDDVFYMPHSRYMTVNESDLKGDLKVLARSEEAGPAIIMSDRLKQIFVTGHLEYDTMTLANEYKRDVEKGLHPVIPENYFPNDDPNAAPKKLWRSHASLLFSNWLNYYVYQQTPYDLLKIGRS